MQLRLEKALQQMDKFNQKMTDYSSDHWYEKDFEGLNDSCLEMYTAVYDLIEAIQKIQEYMLRNL